MTLNGLIDLWLAVCEADGCKAGTLRVYRTRTRSLRAAFGEREPASLTREEFLCWRDAECHFPDGTRKANDTCALILTVLAMLQQFALDGGHVEYPWLRPKDLKKPSRRRRERMPTPEETERILAAGDPDFSLIYRVLRLTGARPGELCGARIEQIINSGGRRTLVLTDHKTARKTGRSRRIPIGADVVALFDAAIGARTSGPIFVRSDGRPWTRDAITTNFRALRRKLNLDERLVPYCARHEFVTAAIKKHGIGRAKDLAGHSSITTTQLYDHPTDAEIHDAQSGLFDNDE